MIRNILASLLLLIPLVSVSIAGQSRPFNPDSDVNYISKHATLDKSAATIKFKSERDGWNHMAYLFKGSFKPNSTYTVFFNYRNPDVPDQNAILQFYARNTASEIPQADYASKDLPLRNNWTRGFISFFTDANADKYALGISSKYPMSCEIKDIVLKNGSPEDFVPIKSESPIEVDRNSLPTGAKEFEVEMPRPEKELIVNASEFGLDESAENCATIINAAIEHCKKIGASKLVLPKGRYKIFEETPIKINGMKDFEFDGGGSTFVYRKRYSGNMAISYCVRTRIRNFNMDWDWETDPLASLVRVVKVVPGEYVDFEFYQYKNFPNRNVRVSNISSYDRKAKSVGIENGATISYEMKRGLHTPPKTEWLNGNTLRVFSVPNKTPLEAGQYYRMQHNYYEMGGIAMNSNKHLRMEDINIYSCCGQATRVRGTQQYWLFKNVNIAPPKGKSRRPISATADHCMIETSAGYFKMIDCDMGFGADDCINMHDNSLFTTKASANSVRTKSARNSYLYNKGEIFEFREDDYSPTGFTAKVADVKVVDKKNGVNEIFFDKEIPNPQNSGFILFNWRYNTSNVIVRNCYFHQNRARGILIIARDVTIENCRFYRNEMGAIKIETGYTFKSWSEGLGVNNVVVRNCSFDTCNPLGVRNENFERDIFMGVYMRTDPSPIRTNFPIIENVLFENNKFKDTFGLVAFISSCHNVTFLNNTFENTKERKTPRPYRGSFYLSHTNNVKIINNKFMLSDFAPNPGIFTDKDSVKNTVVAGNEIVEKKNKIRKEMKLPIKDFAAFIFAAHCALALYADEGDVVMDGFGEGTKYTLSENLGKISEDGSTLEIDCSKHGGTEFNHILITRRGLLKPDTFYTIKFKVLIPEESESKYLHTFVRNSENHDPATDLGHLNASFTFGKYAPKKLVFKIGSDADKSSYFITTHGKAAASIKDFSIVEGNGEGFVSIDENPEPYKIKRNRLPKGAKEFSVELPNNPDGAVLKASDFGIKAGEKDLVKKINNLLEHCKKTGASKLVFDKGVYHITESEAIQLVDLKDFEFDGGGSTFVYDKNGGNVNMYIRSCERIKVGNFNFDWDWEKDPLASVVEVVGVKNDAEEGYVDYKFVEYDKFPRKNLRVANLSCYDPKTKSVGHEGGFGISYEFFAGQNVPKVEWLSDNVLRVYSDSGRIRRVKPGLMFRMQHYYYDMGGFVLDSNRHLTLKDVNIWSCKGHALVITGTQKYTHFYNVNIVRPPNSERRAITCTADHLHIGRSQGFLKLENCEFSLGADDCINMHDTSNFCVKISDTVVQTKNSDAFPIGTKVEFRQGDYSPAKYIATVIGSRKVEGQKRSYEMEFDKPLPEQLFDGFIMFNLDYDTRNVIVRNCYFHDNRARGILILARDVTIENCKFRHNEMGAIKIETGYTFDVWSEGYGVDNVVIRNNTFDTSNPLDVENAGRARDIVMSVYMKTDPSLEQTTYPILKDILVESNTMRDTFGLIAFIASTGNVTFLNNTFINETPRNKPLEYRGEFFVTHSKRTRIVNNTWVKSPHVKTPGVIYDKETVKGLIVKGNKVVDKVEQ